MSTVGVEPKFSQGCAASNPSGSSEEKTDLSVSDITKVSLRSVSLAVLMRPTVPFGANHADNLLRLPKYATNPNGQFATGFFSIDTLEVNNGSEEMITSSLKLGGDYLLAPIIYHT